MINIPSDDSLEDLEIQEITDYLESSGWSQLEFKNERLLLFTRVADGITLTVPSQREFGDYARRVREAVNLLAAIASSEPSYIVGSIKHPNRDVLKLRIIRNEDLLSLDYAASIIEDLRELLFYSASAQKILHKNIRKPASEGFDFLKNCKFGHTFAGSFGFTVESYIYQPPPLLSFKEVMPVPFQRQVLTRLASGLENVVRAQVENDANIIVDNYETGLVANMCDALSDMFTVLQAPTLEYSFVWSQKWSSPVGTDSVTTIKLEPKVLPYLDVASSKLKSLDDVSEEVDVVGHVIELKFKISEEDEAAPERSRQVRIYGRDTKNRWRTFLVNLSPHDYLMACQAHPAGQMVQVSGTLEKGTKFWRLEHPHNFIVYEQEKLI
jgi:hypothetical protein